MGTGWAKPTALQRTKCWWIDGSWHYGELTRPGLTDTFLFFFEIGDGNLAIPCQVFRFFSFECPNVCFPCSIFFSGRTMGILVLMWFTSIVLLLNPARGILTGGDPRWRDATDRRGSSGRTASSWEQVPNSRASEKPVQNWAKHTQPNICWITIA
jgi:hypothetical protein